MTVEPGRPAFVVAVCGSATAPEWFVHARLDAVTAPRAADHNIVVVTGGGEADLLAWSEHTTARVSLQLEPLSRGLYGRYAHSRWAMAVASIAHLVVIFNDRRPWWRLERYSRDGGIPVTHFVSPAVPPPAAVRVADQVRQLDGSGPGGYPD